MLNDETARRIDAHVRAALWARSFARCHRSFAILERFRDAEEIEAKACFARAYAHLRKARAIKREALQ